MKGFNCLKRSFLLCIVLAATLLSTGCPTQGLVAFDPDGVLQARIRRTEYGVPHIEADNLESLAFGVGYAFAQDNVCLVADLITRYNSRRSRYFGPDAVPGSGDAQNLISDFGYLALQIRQQAETHINSISTNTHAMLSGYTKGYNQYLADTGVDNIDPHCAGKPWVKPITEVDMLTSLLAVALLPGSSQFLSAIFVAAPPGQDYKPYPASAMARKAAVKDPLKMALTKVNMPQPNQLGLGSNGWALGSNKTESHKGLLLANPHFPHTGTMRFWQFQITIPGELNVMGASLSGTPGMVNIGFNDHIAWTHTFSSAEHFIVYQLGLDEADATGMQYQLDGADQTITRKTLTTEVAVAPGVVVPFHKDVYYSHFGPMLAVPGKLPWGQDSNGKYVAYSIKDANNLNLDIVDHWLALDMAENMDEFKAAFKRYHGVIFNNTMAVDDKGNTFYIDGSTVPDLSATAIAALQTDPQLIATRKAVGFTILPGTSSVFDFTGPVPYDQEPKLERQDFVQNSNNSYWLTNPAHPITGYSPLFGGDNNEQSLRSRMGQKMLQDSAGTDGRFNASELENALFSFRSYLAEAILPTLLKQCQARGNTPVTVGDQSVDISTGCNVLSQWDGRFYKTSRGAHLFREFAQQFAKDPQWTTAFDPAHPLTTPNGLLANDTTLAQFAKAILNVEAAGIALDATLGDVQFVERPNLDGTPGPERLPWAGANNIEGGFNVFAPVYSSDGSMIPRHIYQPLPGTQLSAEAHGYPVEYGSSWMMIVDYGQNGPHARGLMTYSQSINPDSPHYLDQTRLYSEQPQLRPIRFTEGDIAAHTVSDEQVSLDTRKL